MRIDCCKRDCPRRKVGCHSDCKEYLDQKAILEENKKKKRLEKEYYLYKSCKHKGRVI